MTQNASSARSPVTSEDLIGDVIQRGHRLFGSIWINKERMSGAPCFFGTRVPVKTLFDYLNAGHSVGEFLDDFPGTTREHVEVVLRHASELFEQRGHAA